jgi:hypothetical protein
MFVVENIINNDRAAVVSRLIASLLQSEGRRAVRANPPASCFGAGVPLPYAWLSG